MFQSPRSGQIYSNLAQVCANTSVEIAEFQSPRSGQIYSNSLKDYSRKNKN